MYYFENMDPFDDDDFVDPQWKKIKLPNNYTDKTIIQNYYLHMKDYSLWEDFEKWKGKGWIILYKSKPK